ncbi:uncharacterized protein HMPREF1541_02947 [Cyphellophora europaea CBS 101466]|uniref:Uncharacterized protein n=1 Tax=Cyphellophora europaea (strain CBS 101466) TaxID=1220924 RepID=W2RZB3_CYPE1|nr:uncharacterized protein HMPREF1541_02947 [Cyphellophora europaea CBS 101466]ETN41014.1 hypothetical protein HMPREF1541_02947 [Cyphellophora europaea CBS 101466]
MSTLLDKTSLPLWLWIVIIAVGSLCLIGGVGVIVVCMLRRRRSIGSSVADLPTRRVTVRRGRVVPASHYLSLTGSKFGLNAFEDDARTTRSKSPFEWWNTIKEKRAHPHDDDSYLEASPEGKSHSDGIYTRNEYARSQTSLNQEKDAIADVQEVEPAEPSPTLSRSARHTSFSRPFHPEQQEDPSSPAWSHKPHGRNLSMIKEASPHNSMISSRSLERRSSRLSMYNPGEPTRQERRSNNQHSGGKMRNIASQHQNPSPTNNFGRQSPPGTWRPSPPQSQRPSPPNSRRPSDQSQYLQSSSQSRRSSNHSQTQVPVDQSRQLSNQSRESLRRQNRPTPIPIDSAGSLPQTQHQQQYQSRSDEVPRPVAYRGSRHSLGEQEPARSDSNGSGALSKRSSLVSRHDSMTDHTELSRKPSRPKSLVNNQHDQGPEYWAGRAEMMPQHDSGMPQKPTTPTTPTAPTSSVARTPSRKGNVLRKKSLKRQQVVSYVGT